MDWIAYRPTGRQLMTLKTHAKLVAPRWLLASFLLALAAAPAAAQTPPAGSAPDAKGSPTMQSVARKAPKAMTIDEALEFTKKSPKDTNAWLALGSAYRAAHKYAEAEAAFKKMSALDPNNSTAWTSLGAVYMDQRKSE